MELENIDKKNSSKQQEKQNGNGEAIKNEEKFIKSKNQLPKGQSDVSKLIGDAAQVLNFTFFVPNLGVQPIQNQSLFQQLIYKQNISYIKDYYQEKQFQGRMSNILVKSDQFEDTQNTSENIQKHQEDQFNVLIQKAIDEILTGQPGQMIVRSCIKHQNQNIVFNSILLYYLKQNEILQKLYENKEIYSQTNQQTKNRSPIFEQKITIIQFTEKSQSFQDDILFKRFSQSYIQLFAFSIKGQPPHHKTHYSVHLDEYSQSTMKFLYKLFLKSKISQFKPKIIILAYEVSETLKFEKQALQFLVSKLKKYSHSRLVFVPLENIEVGMNLTDSNPQEINIQENLHKIKKLYCRNSMKDVIQNSFSLLIECLNGCAETKYDPFFQLDQEFKINLYQQVYPYFAKTKSEETSYKLQLKSFKGHIANQEVTEIVRGSNKFPIIDTNSSLKDNIILLNLGDIKYNSESIYFVDYAEKQIVLINKDQIYLIKWNKLQYDNQEVTPTIQEIEYCYNKDEVNFYYQNVLYKFFGYDQFGKWDNTIRFYDFQQKKWNRIQQATHCQAQPSYYIPQDSANQLVKCRVGFGVTTQYDSQLMRSKFILVGGYRECEQFQYCLIIQEIYFEDNQFYSRVYKKEYYNQYFKEVKHPFLLNCHSDQFAIFESTGKYENALHNASICSVKIQEKCKKKIFCERFQYDSRQNMKYLQYLRLINSKQINTDKLGDNIYRIILTDYHKSKQNQNNLSNKEKLKDLGYQEGWKSLLLYLYIDLENQKLYFYNLKEFQNYTQQCNLSQKCLLSSWVENLDDVEIFQFHEENYQYSLLYKDEEKKEYQNRRFILSVDYTKSDKYNDYDEKVVVDYQLQQMYVARCLFPFPKSIQIYQCPFIYFQDIKDTQRNLITKVSMNFKLDIPIEAHHHLLALVQSDNALLIRTTNQLFKVSLQEWKVNDTIDQELYLNVKQKIIPIYFQQNLILFYQVGQLHKIEGQEKCKVIFRYFINQNSADLQIEMENAQEGIIDIQIVQIKQIDENRLQLDLQMYQNYSYTFYTVTQTWQNDLLHNERHLTKSLPAKKVVKQLLNNGNSKKVLDYYENLPYTLEQEDLYDE